MDPHSDTIPQTLDPLPEAGMATTPDHHQKVQQTPTHHPIEQPRQRRPAAHVRSHPKLGTARVNQEGTNGAPPTKKAPRELHDTVHTPQHDARPPCILENAIRISSRLTRILQTLTVRNDVAAYPDPMRQTPPATPVHSAATQQHHHLTRQRRTEAPAQQHPHTNMQEENVCAKRTRR